MVIYKTNQTKRLQGVMMSKKYLIVEYVGKHPIGKSMVLNTNHKNFLKVLSDSRKYLERKDLRRNK